MAIYDVFLNTHTSTNIFKLAGYRQSYISLLVCTVVINILSLALPVVTLQVYDRILPNQGTGTLPILIFGVLLAIFLEAVLRISRAYIIGRSGASYEHMMGCRTVDKILNADLSKMKSYGVGEYMQRMNGIGKLRDFHNGHAFTILVELAFVPIFFGLIVYISGALVLVPIVILTLFALVSVWHGYQLKSVLKIRDEHDDKRFNFLIEALEGVHTLKSFALEKFFERHYEALEEKSTRANYDVTQVTAKTFNTGAIFSHLMVASVITVGAWFVLNGYLSTGGLIAVLLLSGRMMQPIQRALGLWAKYQDFSIAKNNVRDLLSIPQNKPQMSESNVCILPKGILEISDISFDFTTDEKTSTQKLLRNLSLRVKPGETVLISGKHGCGKTTLLKLIAGIYPSNLGNIKIDGKDIQTFESSELVKHIGYISSNPVIFRGTIRDNITSFGQVKESAAREIAAMINIDKDVAKLPGGFDTFLNGNEIDSIPTGLKQRISIARSLAMKPKLILFDNADRALDRHGYSMMYSLLARLKTHASMILISEDKNIRGLADRCFVLKDGRLHSSEKDFQKGNVTLYQRFGT